MGGGEYFYGFFFWVFWFFDALLLLIAAKADALYDLKKRNFERKIKGKWEEKSGLRVPNRDGRPSYFCFDFSTFS